MLHGHHMKKRLSKNKSDIYFVYPGNINAKTGGYIYEKNILEYAKIRDINIRPIALSENYPFPTNNDIKYFLNISEFASLTYALKSIFKFLSTKSNVCNIP